MRGYLTANYTVHDQETYQKYVQAVMPVISQYGGKLIIGDPSSKVLEGQPNQMIVVVEFESVDAAQRFYNSPEYTRAKHFRISAAKGWVVITKEFEMPKH